MNAVIIVLWRPGDPWREQLWGFARARWEQTDLPIIEADHPDGLYAARNRGAKLAGDWDVAVFADADIVLGDTREQTYAAVTLAADDGGYVAAFTTLVALGENATGAVLAGAPITEAPPWKAWQSAWVGAYAISRGLWDELGGYDERFAPYSGQDVAIVHAASTLAHLDRVPGVAVHLWHETEGADRVGHPPSHPGWWPLYQAATGNPAAMRALLER